MPSGGPGGMGPGASEVKYADFVGVTTDGKVVEDLYSVHSTGVSTDAVVKAAQAFLDACRRRSGGPPCSTCRPTSGWPGATSTGTSARASAWAT
ncbi:hypothetical protein [Streptomyces sp. NPDC006527]|uniref:hypothetical protein n=1 Tax=Streptomyces sp. NPDC006527 TaxID=3364749 RepID=UPI0036BEF5F0